MSYLCCLERLRMLTHVGCPFQIVTIETISTNFGWDICKKLHKLCSEWAMGAEVNLACIVGKLAGFFCWVVILVNWPVARSVLGRLAQMMCSLRSSVIMLIKDVELPYPKSGFEVCPKRALLTLYWFVFCVCWVCNNNLPFAHALNNKDISFSDLYPRKRFTRCWSVWTCHFLEQYASKVRLMSYARNLNRLLLTIFLWFIYWVTSSLNNAWVTFSKRCVCRIKGYKLEEQNILETTHIEKTIFWTSTKVQF